MVSGKVALVFFYGIFWAGALSAVGRYQAFDTHMFFSPIPKRRCHAVNRFLCAVFIMNILPALLLWVLYTYIIPNKPGVFPVMTAALASLSVFGFNRILHAIIATESFHSKFYSQKEWDVVIEKWGRGGPNTFWPHFLPGICFLIMFPPSALALVHLWETILT